MVEFIALTLYSYMEIKCGIAYVLTITIIAKIKS